MDADWEDLRTVLALVREGSLAKAGQVLGVNYTTVARRVARAEDALGQTLFERLSDGYHPTETGLRVAAHSADMEAGQNAMLRELRGRDMTLRGPLVLTAPQLLIGPHLSHVLREFRAKNPDVDLNIRATNDLLDLSRREADLAIRVSNDPGDTLTGLRLTAQNNAIFGGRHWQQQLQDNPNAPLDWLIYSPLGAVPKAAKRADGLDRIAYRFDDMTAMLGAAKEGLGVVRLPLFLGAECETLYKLPLMPPQPYSDIWVVAHRDVWPSAKVQAFVGILAPYFRAQRGVFASNTNPSDR